jgi:TorA maturation chaperone TorD
MPNQSPTHQQTSPSTLGAEGFVQITEPASSQEQQYRAAAYSIIAALLRDVPSEQTLQQIAAFEQVGIDEDEMLLAMSSLGLAAQAVNRESIRDEYQNLFIGVGRGELMPYGSWYLTGYLMEQPLSALRDNLTELGIERDPQVKEPEDHIASLCEVMSILISDSVELRIQTQFFETHLGSWCEKFFKDLETAESASFYRSVGRFGSAFISIDKQYLNMPV